MLTVFLLLYLLLSKTPERRQNNLILYVFHILSYLALESKNSPTDMQFSSSFFSTELIILS